MPAPVLISIGWWIFAYIHDWCEGLEWILWIVIYQWAILIYHQIIYGLDLHINKALTFTMWLMINLLGTLSIWCAGLKSALDIHVVGGHALFWGAHYLRSPKVEKCLRREECCPIRYIQKKNTAKPLEMCRVRLVPCNHGGLLHHHAETRGWSATSKWAIPTSQWGRWGTVEIWP